MQPVICVTSYFVPDNELDEENRARGFPGQDMSMCTLDYLQGIKAGGGAPIIISPLTDIGYIECVLSKCDGLLLTGGEDIEPSFYGESKHDKCGKTNNYRDNFEMMVLDRALKMDKPVLGICRGLQIINIYYGGSVYQDIKSYDDNRSCHANLKEDKYFKAHQVEIAEGSHLAKAYGKLTIKTNSLHHQAVNKLGENLTVTARAADSTVEGIEDNNRNFLVAVQWHPEMMFEKYTEQSGIFKYFIKKIKSS